MSSSREIFLKARAEAAALAVHLFGQPNTQLSTSTELRFGANGSIKVVVAGQHAGLATDWAEDFHGDITDLFARVKGTNGHETVLALREWFGDSTPLVDAVQKPPLVKDTQTKEGGADNRLATAKRIWEAAGDIRGTPGEEYLSARVCRVPIPESVFKSGSLVWLEKTDVPDAVGAIIAKMQDPRTGKTTGVHRTFIGANNRKLKVALLGRRNPIRLGERNAPGPILVAEGIESAISAGILFGQTNIFAAGSAGSLATFPVFGASGIIICGDNDPPNILGKRTGQTAAADCAACWAAEGREVTTRFPKNENEDFNDLLRRLANAD